MLLDRRICFCSGAGRRGGLSGCRGTDHSWFKPAVPALADPATQSRKGFACSGQRQANTRARAFGPEDECDRRLVHLRPRVRMAGRRSGVRLRRATRRHPPAARERAEGPRSFSGLMRHTARPGRWGVGSNAGPFFVQRGSATLAQDLPLLRRRASATTCKCLLPRASPGPAVEGGR
jgi:hypothetical protein